jgi:uncharacterized protein YjbI with pentapeptide repeats
VHVSRFPARCDCSQVQVQAPKRVLKWSIMTAGVALALLVFQANPLQTLAISGGGLDYAEQTIAGMDFSKKTLNEKVMCCCDEATLSAHTQDFSGANAVQTKFAGAQLRGARFFKANLKEADFTGMTLRAFRRCRIALFRGRFDLSRARGLKP